MPALPVEMVAPLLATGASTRMPNTEPARFQPGDAVIAKNMHPLNHTRLPRYIRGKRGTVRADNGTFSFNDTVAWYKGVAAANAGDASKFARLFPVPGMNHCSAGLSTDQFDLLTPLVQWVEQGVAPQAVTAQVRGAGNPGGVNTELPADWSAQRSRPLCAYPTVATYNGSGSLEEARNFSCK